MHYTELLDKDQQIQLEIFQYFLAQRSQLADKELRQNVAVSRPTLKNACKALSDRLSRFHPAAELTRQKDTLELTLPADFSVADFIYLYFEEALAYRMLCSIFLEQTISITKLALENHLSEATIFRSLKSLNQSLAEFDIQFKNGQLTGSEWQIRIFYFQLFKGIIPLDKAQDKLARLQSIHPLVNVLQQHFDFQLNRASQTSVTLWLAIMQRRLDYRKKPDLKIKKVIREKIDQDPFYQELKNVLARFLSRFALFGSDEEALYFYLFFMSEGLVPADSHWYQSSPFIAYFSAVDNKICQLITQEEESGYTDFLLPYHVKVAFYKGELRFLESQTELLSDRSPAVMNECMSLIERNLSRKVSHSQWELLDRAYGLIESFHQRKKQEKLLVGVFCEKNLEAEERFRFVSQTLAHEERIIVEKKAEETYDLLIVNEPYQAVGARFQHLYLLTGSLSVFEGQRLNQTIRQLLRQKEAGD